MTLRVPLPVLAAFLLGIFVGDFHAQDVPLQGPISTGGAGPGASPFSVSATLPTSATSPGEEWQFAIDNHAFYTFHAGRWSWSPRIAMPVPTPAP